MSTDANVWMAVTDRYARINEVYRQTMYDIARFEDLNVDDMRAMARTALINAAMEHSRKTGS